MNKTAAEWSAVKAASVTAGSVAQATNVLQMALDDIAALHRALAPFVAAYAKHNDPGVSDLYDEQPVAWHVELGAYRAARRAA